MSQRAGLILAAAAFAMIGIAGCGSTGTGSKTAASTAGAARHPRTSGGPSSRAGQSARASTDSGGSDGPGWASRGLITYKCANSLCVERPDGSGERQLLPAGPSPQWDPAFSLNGTRVALRGYYGPGDGEYALYRARTNGCRARRLTRSIAGNPSWSPDERWIAFDTSGEGQIWKVRPNGTSRTLLASSTGGKYSESPAWSPRGKQIAFVRYAHRHGQIWVMRTDGSHERLLHTDARASDETPAWSHDGAKIAFVRRSGNRASIEVMRSDGSRVRTLTTRRAAAWNPVWLPRDAGIAYLAGSSRIAGTGNLYVIRPNGTDSRRVPAPRTAQFTWAAAQLAKRRC